MSPLPSRPVEWPSSSRNNTKRVGKGRQHRLSARAGGGGHLGNPLEPVINGGSWALLRCL